MNIGKVVMFLNYIQEKMVDDFIVNREEHYGWCNNLKGFIPYRYFIDNNLTF